jgi:hypothetical protein
MSLNISALNPIERLSFRDVLISNGFGFEKRKHRKPSTKELVEHTVGTRLLDKANYGRVVIGVDFDAEKDHWFVAQNWESSQLNPVKIYEISDGKMKLSAATLISKITTEFSSPVVSQPAPKKEPVTEHELNPEPKKEPEKKPEPKKEVKSMVLSEITEPELSEPANPVEGKKVETKPDEEPKVSQKIPENTPSPDPVGASKPAPTKEVPDILINPEQMQVIKTVGSKVSVTKNTKGYTWEITAHADNMNDAIDQVIAADIRLKIQFGGVI